MAIGPGTIRKVRARIIPFIFLLYAIAFLDRINIGFAALTMNRGLAISSQQYGLLSGIFFIGYFLFEVPSNLLLHKIGARIWIARILITWGVIAALTGLVHGVHQLYAMRFLLGVAEAGYFPGILLYLTYWFPHREQARAIALFMIGIPVASIFGAPVSGLILDHVHWLGISSWRWLLILEGVPAIVCGILTFFLLPSRPAEAKFLAEEEKDWITAELASEAQEKTGRHCLSAWQALSHRRVWHIALISFTFQTGGYAIPFWMPQALRSLSNVYSNTVVGFLVAVPYIVGTAAMILVSLSSDRRMERRYHAAIPSIVGGAGLILVGAAGAPWVSVMMWSFAAMLMASHGPLFSLPSGFLAGASAASGIAVVTSIGSLGGFVGPFVIGSIVKSGGGLHGGPAFAGMALFACATLLPLLPRKAQAPPRA